MIRIVRYPARRSLIHLAILGGMALAVAPVRGMPVEDYLKYRRQLAYDPRLTYEAASADWAAHYGKALEIRGALNGFIEGSDCLTFMITLDGGTALALVAPPAERALLARAGGTRIRALITPEKDGARGSAPVRVLAAADDSEVTYREKIASEQEARRKARITASRHTTASRTIAAGRGVSLRPMNSLLQGVSDMARKYLSPEAQSIYPHYAAFIIRHNKRLSKAEVDAITVGILYYSQRHRVDPRLVVALIIAESDFRPQTTSHKGAMGLGQIMPDEARSFKLTDPYDPIQNIRAAVNMIRMKLDMYRDGDQPAGQYTVRQISLAMAAYNAGAGAVRKHGGIPPYRETQRYVQRVLSLYKALCGA